MVFKSKAQEILWDPICTKIRERDKNIYIDRFYNKMPIHSIANKYSIKGISEISNKVKRKLEYCENIDCDNCYLYFNDAVSNRLRRAGIITLIDLKNYLESIDKSSNKIHGISINSIDYINMDLIFKYQSYLYGFFKKYKDRFDVKIEYMMTDKDAKIVCKCICTNFLNDEKIPFMVEVLLNEREDDKIITIYKNSNKKIPDIEFIKDKLGII